MDTLRAMRVFARVLDEGSLAGAARALDLAPAVVTRLVAELESHLGVRLLNRSTRRLVLTEVGAHYLERVRQILADVDEAEAMVSAAVVEPRGQVRLLMPPALAAYQVAPKLPAFHALYPQVTVQIAAPGLVETVDEAYDLTLVLARQPLEGQFIARRLARSEVILCASPAYLARRGRPQHPRDLAAHDVMTPPIADLMRGVRFERGQGDQLEVFVLPVRPQGVLSTLHVDTNRAAALAGLGIVGLLSFVMADALREGRLERVLPEWRLVLSTSIWACMPSRQHLPARTRVMLDFLVAQFGGEDRDPWQPL